MDEDNLSTMETFPSLFSFSGLMTKTALETPQTLFLTFLNGVSLQDLLKFNMGFLFLSSVGVCLVYYFFLYRPDVRPADSPQEERAGETTDAAPQLTELQKVIRGQGVHPLIFLWVMSLGFWHTYYYFPLVENVTGGGVDLASVFQVLYCTAWFGFVSWIMPLEQFGVFLAACSKGVILLGKMRKQIPKLAPYAVELSPFIPKMLSDSKKLWIMIENVEVLGDAFPALMKQKKYILPVMGELIDKIDILLPTIPAIMPHLHKVAPKIHLLLPRLEELAPFVEDLMPLWDEIEPNLELMMEEVDNLVPVLPKISHKMDRMTPMMSLLPLAHKTGVFQYGVIRDTLPIATALLPKAEDTVQRFFLRKMAETMEAVGESSLKFLKVQENRLIEARRARTNREALYKLVQRYPVPTS